jgi:hypothetical protein
MSVTQHQRTGVNMLVTCLQLRIYGLKDCTAATALAATCRGASAASCIHPSRACLPPFPPPSGPLSPPSSRAAPHLTTRKYSSSTLRQAVTRGLRRPAALSSCRGHTTPTAAAAAAAVAKPGRGQCEQDTDHSIRQATSQCSWCCWGLPPQCPWCCYHPPLALLPQPWGPIAATPACCTASPATALPPSPLLLPTGPPPPPTTHTPAGRCR